MFIVTNNHLSEWKIYSLRLTVKWLCLSTHWEIETLSHILKIENSVTYSWILAAIIKLWLGPWSSYKIISVTTKENFHNILQIEL